MTFKTSKCQEIFRNRFTGISGEPFVDFGDGKRINNEIVEQSDLVLFKDGIPEDIKAFYYKSLLSYVEGLAAISRKNYTWATIKLYYSFYFGLRCSLLCRNIIIVRANKHLYYTRIQTQTPIYEKPAEMTDHGGAIDIYSTYFKNSDIICLQKIDDKDAYKWLKDCREIVNYKDAEFHDPSITDLWAEIIKDISQSSFSHVLSNYVEKAEQYCSQATTAILAIPTVRIRRVVKDIINEGIEALSSTQKDWIRTIAQEFINVKEIEDLLI